MRGKRTSSDIKAKIIKEKLTNPEATLREIREKTGVNIQTVSDTINEVPDILKSTDKDEIMAGKLDNIIDQIINIQEISLGNFKDKAMSNKLTTKEVKDLSDIAKTNFDRKQILKGKPTSIIDINLQDKSILELEELRKQLLG